MYKKLIIILTTALIRVVFTVVNADSIEERDMRLQTKEQLIDAAYTEALKKDIKLDQAYALSMPLFASALIQGKDRYRKNLNAILPLLGDDPENSKAAWMYGRVLLSSQGVKDENTVINTKQNLLSLLENKEMPKDAMSGWAWAYLLASDKSLYDDHKRKLEEAMERANQAYIEHPKENASTLFWTLTMNLYAAANTQHKEDYDEILKQFTALTGRVTLQEAIALVPKDDFRAWLTSTIRLAALEVDDKVTLSSIKQPDCDSTTPRNDTMMSMATEIKISAVYNPTLFSNKKMEEPRSSEETLNPPAFQ